MRPLLITCLLIGLIAVAVPNVLTHYMGKEAGSPRAGNLITESEATSGSDSVKPARTRQVEITAGRDGHFYVDAEVNSARVRLIVDTGATVVALRVSDAKAAGIQVARSDFTNPVQTANGTTMAAETVLDHITVDDIEVRRIRALVVPDDQLAMSLLGGSFLNGLQRFEVADGTLIFEN